LLTYIGPEPDDHRDMPVRHSDGLWYPATLGASLRVEGRLEGYVR